MRGARAFVFAAEEDFGIVPLEAQACGTPVIAYARGAAIETLRGTESRQPTGVFFETQTPTAIAASDRRVRGACPCRSRRRHVARMPNASRQRVFAATFVAFVGDAWLEHMARRP